MIVIISDKFVRDLLHLRCLLFDTLFLGFLFVLDLGLNPLC